MHGGSWIVGRAAVVAVVVVMAGAGGWAQQQPRSTPEPVAAAVQTQAVPVLPSILLLRKAARTAPPRTVGPLAIPTAPTGFAIVGSATVGGGRFFDYAGDADAWLGNNGFGIQSFGTNAGGLFASATSSGTANIGYGDVGVYAGGNAAGGIFYSTSGVGAAYVGVNGYGIEALGDTMGGHFSDNASGVADLATGDYGIHASGYLAGGHFTDTASGVADVATGDYGIRAKGNSAGGHFTDNASGVADVAYGDYGIRANGNSAGGHFTGNASGVADVATGDYGIRANGNSAGGYFANVSNSAYAYVGNGTYKILGNGAVSFVQNHPTDPRAVIVYAAPEGDEVATYTRGTARLVNGEARVALGDTFKWVTNPDIGLTAHITPVGGWCDLYVAAKGSDEVLVRSKDGSDCMFDYLVYGLRIGFEQTTVVQEKKQQSYIPSMKDHRDLLARRPDLVKYTALARYTAERAALGIKEPLNVVRANALKAAVHEFDPAVDKIETPQPLEAPRSASPDSGGHFQGISVTSPAPVQQQVTGGPAVANAPEVLVPIGSQEDVQPSSVSSREQLATRMAVSGAVEPGDVLVVDRQHPELFVRGSRSADPTVVGVVVPESAAVAHGTSQKEGTTAQVALFGVVLCKVDAGFGAITPGDLLVSAPTPGYAMHDASPLPGTVVGKALEPLGAGQGMIRILVTLR